MLSIMRTATVVPSGTVVRAVGAGTGGAVRRVGSGSGAAAVPNSIAAMLEIEMVRGTPS